MDHARSGHEIPQAQVGRSRHCRLAPAPLDEAMTWISFLHEKPDIVEIEVDLRVGGEQTVMWGGQP